MQAAYQVNILYIDIDFFLCLKKYQYHKVRYTTSVNLVSAQQTEKATYRFVRLTTLSVS